jgi:hypothetical protein
VCGYSAEDNFRALTPATNTTKPVRHKTMRKLTFIFIFLMIVNLIEVKSQIIKLDTISFSNIDSSILYRFPLFKFKNKSVEDNVNKIFYENIISEFVVYDSNITRFSDLTYEDLEGMESSSFITLFNNNNLVSIKFILSNKMQPRPYIFMQTIDIKNKKILTLNDILDTSMIIDFYKMINEMIDKDIDAAVDEIINDEDIDDKSYLLECYEGFRNQKDFDFYIEDLNKSIVINPSCCCRNGSDGFSEYYIKFSDINKYLKRCYKKRLQ